MAHEPKKRHAKAYKRTRRYAVSLRALGIINTQVSAISHRFAKAVKLGIAKHQPKANKTTVTRA